MMKWLIFFLVGVGLSALQHCQGIQFSLERDAVTQGRRAVCAVLTCVERSQGSVSTTSSTKLSDAISSSTTTSAVTSISRMAVYKSHQDGTEAESDKGEKTLVASVDSRQPRISRVANAMKVEGWIEASMTSLRLELFKQEDCRGGFTCEVFAVDAQGRELVRTSHLLQYQQQTTPSAASGMAGQQGWTPAVAMHLVDLAQQLNTNMELMRSAMDEYRDRMSGVEDKVAALEKDLTSSMVTLENGLGDTVDHAEQELRDKFDLLENRMSDKLTSMEKGLGDTVDHAEQELRDKFDLLENRMSDKLTSLEKDLYKVSLSQTGIETKLDSSLQHIEDQFSRQENEMNSSETKLFNKLDEIKNSQASFESFENKWKKQIKLLFQSEITSLGLNEIGSKVGKDFITFETAIENKMHQYIESLKQEMHESEVALTMNLTNTLGQNSLTLAKEILSQVNSSLIWLDESVQGHFQELTSNINERGSETQAIIRDTVQNINVTGASDMASAVRDVLALKTCKRGAISLLTQPSYPYPVIRPGPGDSLAVPYLCDTVTDGGGWIIIQRRATGHVDFYRNWADYKRGFGTLDDDFWLGNDNIHAITSSGEYELRVELRYAGKSGYAHYDTFAISDEAKNYALSLGAYTKGTAGDSLSGHAGMPFTTLDRDNDSYSANCAVTYTGAWWYGDCHSSNLNGKWGAGADKGPRWGRFSSDKAVSFSEMKIRKVA